MTSQLLLSKLGGSLLIVGISALIIVSYFIPSILSLVGLSMKENWSTATKMIVQLTIGSWVASTIASIVRAYVWLQAMLSRIPSTTYHKNRDEVKMVQNLFLWILGLMTVLSVYVTQWFSGGQ